MTFASTEDLSRLRQPRVARRAGGARGPRRLHGVPPLDIAPATRGSSMAETEAGHVAADTTRIAGLLE